MKSRFDSNRWSRWHKWCKVHWRNKGTKPNVINIDTNITITLEASNMSLPPKFSNCYKDFFIMIFHRPSFLNLLNWLIGFKFLFFMFIWPNLYLKIYGYTIFSLMVYPLLASAVNKRAFSEPRHHFPPAKHRSKPFLRHT